MCLEVGTLKEAHRYALTNDVHSLGKPSPVGEPSRKRRTRRLQSSESNLQLFRPMAAEQNFSGEITYSVSGWILL